MIPPVRFPGLKPAREAGRSQKKGDKGKISGERDVAGLDLQPFGGAFAARKFSRKTGKAAASWMRPQLFVVAKVFFGGGPP